MRKSTMIGFLLMSLMSSAAYAQSENPSVYILPYAQMQKAEPQTPEYHFFGGSKIVLPFLIRHVVGSIADVRVESSQMAAALEAPYDLQARLVSPVKKEAFSPCNNLVSLNLPAVNRETAFELKFQIQLTPEGSWQEAGSAILHIYPANILEPLKQWSKKVQLRLDDSQKILGPRLEEQGITFVDVKAAQSLDPKTPVVTIMIMGENTRAASLPRPKLGEAIVVFKEHTALYLKSWCVRSIKDKLLR